MPGKRTHTLTAEQKTFISTELACMAGLSEVRDAFKKEFGIELNLQTIAYYDPTVADSKLGPKWVKFFNTTRERFIKDCSRVPIANQAYRLRELQKVLDKERSRDNTVGIRETLEQAAKEDGGAFTNKREHTGPNGAPIAHSLAVSFVSPPKKTEEKK